MNRLVAFALLAVLVASAAAQCTFYDQATGCSYDVSSLTLPVDSATFYQTEVLESTSAAAAGVYEANVCGPLNPIISNDTNVAVTQSVNNGSVIYSCGQADSYVVGAYSGAILNDTLPCQGVSITYIDGTLCPGLAVQRTTVLNIGCNANYTEAQLVSADEGDSCNYGLQMYSVVACGSQEVASPTLSASISETASTVVSPAVTVSETATVSVTVSVDSPSVSMTISETISESASAQASPISDGSESSSPSITVSITTTATPTMSETVSASAVASLSVGASPYASFSPSTSASVGASSSNGNGWIWWVVGAVAIILIVIAVGVAGFVVYRKKQQSYDSIGYE